MVRLDPLHQDLRGRICDPLPELQLSRAQSRGGVLLRPPGTPQRDRSPAPEAALPPGRSLPRLELGSEPAVTMATQQTDSQAEGCARPPLVHVSVSVQPSLAGGEKCVFEARLFPVVLLPFLRELNGGSSPKTNK